MRITPLNSGGEPLLTPDLVWCNDRADLQISDAQNIANPAGFEASNTLLTTVLICLMTDRRVDESEIPDGEENKGWPGDSFDLQDGETELGSKLWLLRRRALTDEIIILAEDYAREALNPIIAQGAVARFDVEVSADKLQKKLELSVVGYGRDGAIVFDQRFQVLWDQINDV